MCSHTSEPRPISSHYYPGTVAGEVAGTGVGVVAGNVAGFGAGFGGGFWHGASSPFQTPTTRTVRNWRTETTSDGRTLQVPVEIPVDELGRPTSHALHP